MDLSRDPQHFGRLNDYNARVAHAKARLVRSFADSLDHVPHQFLTLPGSFVLEVPVRIGDSNRETD